MISLLHPSRGRPEQSKQTTDKWLQRAGVECELIVSIDTSDDKAEEYQKIYKKVLINDNKSLVDATNIAAKKAKGDILLYLSDDFDCPENWGELVLKEFDTKKPLLVKVDDCLQAFHVHVLTIPIMNRALYKKLTYFWHPAYLSMHVDVDLYKTVQKAGYLKECPHLKFPHLHYSIGKAPKDETYRRSDANWGQGQEILNKRKQLGFPI